MEQRKLEVLIENELYKLVLAYSDDELKKINDDAIGKAIYQFVSDYKELTPENIDYIMEYIKIVIDRNKKRLNKKEEEEEER